MGFVYNLSSQKKNIEKPTKALNISHDSNLECRVFAKFYPCYTVKQNDLFDPP